MKVTDDIRYIGVDDHEVDLFEGQYKVPNGMSYNSYVILDDKIAVMDSVSGGFEKQWLANLEKELGGRKPDYFVVQHMEPDHSSGINEFMEQYKDAVIVSSDKAFGMMKDFYGDSFEERRIVIREGDRLELGRHVLNFVAAPMVHWPEVIVSYESTEKVLFSADAFGTFGANDVPLPDDWAEEASRYYIGIVGKYGAQVQALLKKAAGLDIEIICPLHGPVLKENLGYYTGLYDLWSSYTPELEGVVIAYTSVYGNTEKAVMRLRKELLDKSIKATCFDLARDDIPAAVAAAFRYDKLVLATTSYNSSIFPPMRTFIEHLNERGYKNRKVGLIENGSWAPCAARVMKGMLETCRDLTFLEPTVTIKSALSSESSAQLELLAAELQK